MIRTHSALGLFSAYALAFGSTSAAIAGPDFKVPPSSGAVAVARASTTDFRPGRLGDFENGVRVVPNALNEPSGLGVRLPDVLESIESDEIRGMGPIGFFAPRPASTEPIPPRTPAAILPEPAAIVMMGIGAAFALGYRRAYHARRALRAAAR